MLPQLRAGYIRFFFLRDRQGEHIPNYTTVQGSTVSAPFLRVIQPPLSGLDLSLFMDARNMVCSNHFFI